MAEVLSAIIFFASSPAKRKPFDAFTNRGSVLPMLKENIKDVIGGSDTDRISAVNQKIKEKQTELLKAGQDEEQTTSAAFFHDGKRIRRYRRAARHRCRHPESNPST